MDITQTLRNRVLGDIRFLKRSIETLSESDPDRDLDLLAETLKTHEQLATIKWGEFSQQTVLTELIRHSSTDR